MAELTSSNQITPAAFAIMSGNKDYELVEGRLVRREKGNRAAWIATNLGFIISKHVHEHRLGWVFASSAGWILGAHKNTVRRPSVSFVRAGRFSNEMPSDTFDALAPDLVVEVLSPFDRREELVAKMHEYVRVGVQTAWLIDPGSKAVLRFESHRSRVAVNQGQDTLDGGHVLPGFRCVVQEIFDGLATGSAPRSIRH